MRTFFKLPSFPQKPTENNKKYQKKKTSLMKQGNNHNYKPQNMKIIFQIVRHFEIRKDAER